MPKKGETNNPNGRPKGSKNQKTKEWEQLGDAIRGRHTERFNRIMDELEPEKFVDKFLQVLEYFEPKRARVENVHEGDVSVTINEVKKYGGDDSSD